MKVKNKSVLYKLSVTQIILLSFMAVILIGTALLCAPFSSSRNEWTDFVTALFTATSATCVTGLTVVNTAGYFSTIGHIIILALIQVGGLGIMTIISVFSVLLSNSSSLRNRNIAMQATGAINYSEIKALLKKIFLGTLSIEFIGAALLSASFIPKFGFLKGIKTAVFTAVSAFCNAGFDVFGDSSLSQFVFDPFVTLTISLLIITGGIGYICWSDFIKHKFRFKYYSLHSKIALTTAAALLLLGTGLFMFTEFSAAFGDMNFAEKLLNAFFESVTLRTAGFYTVDQAKLSDGGVLIAYILMFIGGASGSTAGGLKTTTFAVLIISFISTLKNKEHVEVFKRRIPDGFVKAALSIVMAYIILLATAIIIILSIDVGVRGITLKNVTFEAISAIATVGVSRGITARLSVASKITLIMLMFMGRVGGFTFMLAFTKTRQTPATIRPKENILIG